jgi:aminoglycoside phosphotransferase (APT) family kinase protein
MAPQPGSRDLSDARGKALDSQVREIARELGLKAPRITRLRGGPANSTLRVQDTHHDLVFRLAGESGRVLHANLESELAMLEAAAAAGLAPAVVLARPELGYVVMQHAAGRTPGAHELRDPAFLRRLGAWIAQLQAVPLPIGLAPVDFGERAATYLAQLQDREPLELHARLVIELAVRRAAFEPTAQRVCCHHDLHRRNLVDAGDSILAIDWEYAGPGDPAADLAACIGYHDLDTAQVDALLAGYGRDGSVLRARLAALGWIFDCLWYGWNAVATRAGLAVDLRLQQRLGARLSA